MSIIVILVICTPKERSNHRSRLNPTKRQLQCAHHIFICILGERNDLGQKSILIFGVLLYTNSWKWAAAHWVSIKLSISLRLFFFKAPEWAPTCFHSGKKKKTYTSLIPLRSLAPSRILSGGAKAPYAVPGQFSLISRNGITILSNNYPIVSIRTSEQAFRGFNR